MIQAQPTGGGEPLTCRGAVQLTARPVLLLEAANVPGDVAGGVREDVLVELCALVGDLEQVVDFCLVLEVMVVEDGRLHGVEVPLPEPVDPAIALA
jgi:hypothetical protein